MTTEVAQYQVSGRRSADIAASIERGITTGHLAPGQELPSVRRLAADLGVSPTTVAAAYRDLKHRGIVIAHDRSATTVAHRPPLHHRPTAPTPAGATDVASGNPDPALLPDLTAVLATIEAPGRLYDARDEDPPLIDHARAWFTGDGIAADHVTVVSGALDGLERVLGVHARPGDRVAVEDPAYTGVVDLVRALGLEPVPVAVDDDGPRPDALAAALDAHPVALVVTPRAQNPTGSALSPERANALAAMLSGHPDVVVIEDDHAGEVAGAPAVSLTSGRERWAVVRSLAKSLGPDLRVALLAGDEDTVGRVRGRQRLGPGWVSHLLQRVALAAWERAATDGTLAHATATYAARRDAVVGALGQRGIAAHGRSGLNVWIPVPVEGPVLQRLLHAGWVAQPGELYRLQTGPAIRLTVGALPVERADALADAVADALASDGSGRAV